VRGGANFVRARTWRTGSGHWPAAVLGFALLIVGLAFGRSDVALLGVPLVLAAVIARNWRTTSLTAHFDSADVARPGVIDDILTVDCPGADAVHVRIFAPGHRSTEVVVAAHRALQLTLASRRTGPHITFTAQVRARGPLDARVVDPAELRAADRLVLPTALRLARVPVPSRLRGLTGSRTSRRLGDGAELRDIAILAPGDRLRRVDWRTTARRSPDLDELYVRRTFATAEANAVLVLDSRDDVAPDLRTWRGSAPQRIDEPTSLDLARHAAASIATALVNSGDRVGLEDLAHQRRPLAPAAGRRHLRRILHALAVATPAARIIPRIQAPQVPTDAIVYLFTTLLDDAPLTLVHGWAQQGIPVVVVDTLPAVKPVRDRRMRLAWRITAMERTARVRELSDRGIAVLRWTGAERETAVIRLEALVRAAERHQPVKHRAVARTRSLSGARS
jgi:uncharacterized protein (DUF58 family)